MEGTAPARRASTSREQKWAWAGAVALVMGLLVLDPIFTSTASGVAYRAGAPDGGHVAVKVLRASLGAPDLQRLFEREARIRVTHENVIRVLDAGTAEDGAPYLVFELLEGETLAERLQR